MLNVNLLKKDIDSFEVKLKDNKVEFNKKSLKRFAVDRLDKNINVKCDSILEYPASITDIYDFKTRKKIYKEAVRSLEKQTSKIETHEKELESETLILPLV